MVRMNCRIGRFISDLQHDIGRDGDYNPFEDNGLHTVYIFFDENSQLAATYVSNELTNAFFTQLGVIMVNVYVQKLFISCVS
jgi:hypothetical protein